MKANNITHSIIVLLEHQHERFSQYITDVHKFFSTKAFPFEIIIIANGTADYLRKQLQSLNSVCANNIKVFGFHKKTTQ